MTIPWQNLPAKPPEGRLPEHPSREDAEADRAPPAPASSCRSRRHRGDRDRRGGAHGGAAPFELDAERDAFTPSALCVGEDRGLVEGSCVFIDNSSGAPTNNYPELLIRQGANDWWDWRSGVNYGVGSQGNVVTSVEVGEGKLDGSTLYESSILYGFKLGMSHQDGLLPDSCFIMEASTPTFGDVFGTVPVATLVAGWNLGDDWRIDGAIRYAYSEGALEWYSRWSPSVVL